MNTKKFKGLKALKAFTLLEMIIVIAIIAIMMMLLVPNISQMVRDQEIRQANTRAQEIYLAAQDYMTAIEPECPDPIEFFGIPEADLKDTVWYVGVDYSSVDSREIPAKGSSEYNSFYGSNAYSEYFGHEYDGQLCKEDIMLYYKQDGKTNDESLARALQVANGIVGNFSGDKECSFLVAIYPRTYTVKYVVASAKKNKSKVNADVSTYNWPAVEAVGLGKGVSQKSSFYVADGNGTDGSRGHEDYTIGNGTYTSVVTKTKSEVITHSRYQEYDSDANGAVRYTGQYPMPPVA